IMATTNNTSQRNNLKKTYEDLLKVFKTPSLKPELQLTIVEIFNCDLIVNLNDLFSNHNINPKARIFRIYGNIIQLSSTLTIPPLNGSGIILIVARRIEIKPGCQIIVNYKKSFRIVIYAKEITSKLEVIATNQLKNESNLLKFDANISKDNKNVGKSLTIRDDKSLEDKDLYNFDNVVLKKHSFLKMLRYSLLIASVLFYDEPEITRSILSWIVRITKESKEAKELCYHGLTISIQLNTVDRKKDKFQFVPPLDMNIYKKQIDMLMEFTKYYEEKYKQLLDNELKKEKLDVSLADHCDQVEMYENLNDMKKKRYESAQTLTKKIESVLQ
ncbi:5032_t:CDS:2, partial [Cetraspora pellucida]